MAEYIDREAFFDSIERMKPYHQDADDIAEMLQNFPATDVRPVVRGQWKLDSDPGEPWRYVCNICGEKTKDTVMGKPRANYCPNCGADMREES